MASKWRHSAQQPCLLGLKLVFLIGLSSSRDEAGSKEFFPWPTLDKISSSVTFKLSSLSAESACVRGQTARSLLADQPSRARASDVLRTYLLRSWSVGWFYTRRYLQIPAAFVVSRRKITFLLALNSFYQCFYEATAIRSEDAAEVMFMRVCVCVSIAIKLVCLNLPLTPEFLRSWVTLLTRDHDATGKRAWFKRNKILSDKGEDCPNHDDFQGTRIPCAVLPPPPSLN